MGPQQAPHPPAPLSPASMAPPPLPGIGTLFSQAWALFKERYFTLVGILFLFAVMLFIIGTSSIALMAVVISKLILTDVVGFGPTLILTVVAVYLTMLIVVAWMLLAILHALGSQERIGVIQSYRLAGSMGRILGLVWVQILSAIAIFIGFVLFIIPGILLSVWLFFSQYCFAFEHKRGVDALSASYDLVRGRFFGVFIRIFVCSLLISVPMVFLSFLTEASNVEETVVTVGVLVQFLLVMFVLAPFMLTYCFVLYKGLRWGLEPRAAATVLAPPPPPAAPPPATQVPPPPPAAAL